MDRRGANFLLKILVLKQKKSKGAILSISMQRVEALRFM